MEIDEVWRKIEALAGQQFTQMRGGKFTYSVGGGHVIPDRTNHHIPKSHFREALTRWPVTGPGELQDLRGPSYIYAILADPRLTTQDGGKRLLQSMRRDQHHLGIAWREILSPRNPQPMSAPVQTDPLAPVEN